MDKQESKVARFIAFCITIILIISIGGAYLNNSYNRKIMVEAGYSEHQRLGEYSVWAK